MYYALPQAGRVTIAVYDVRGRRVRMLVDEFKTRFDFSHDEPLTQGPKAGAFYPREEFLRDRAEWYASRGCDEKGYPTRQTLDQLGLGFATNNL